MGCSFDCIFFIGRRGDQIKVLTPSLDLGGKETVARLEWIRILALAGIAVEHGHIYKEELARFDEAFVCSTHQGPLAVLGIDKNRLYTLRAESVYKKIKRLFFAAITQKLGYAVDFATGKKIDAKNTLESS